MHFEQSYHQDGVKFEGEMGGGERRGRSLIICSPCSFLSCVQGEEGV